MILQVDSDKPEKSKAIGNPISITIEIYIYNLGKSSWNGLITKKKIYIH